MDILKLGKLIEPSEFVKYIDEAEKWETVVHKYGGEFIVPDYPCWMEYKNEGNIVGSISFSRNTHKNPMMIEMVEKVIKALSPIFPDDTQPIKERVHFIRTTGFIVLHKDEAGRNSCINIGVKNSSGAITRMSNDGIYENFQQNNTPWVIKEGIGYLMNVNQWHEVESISDEPRYLITYGFGTKFNVIKDKLKYPNEEVSWH